MQSCCTLLVFKVKSGYTYKEFLQQFLEITGKKENGFEPLYLFHKFEENIFIESNILYFFYKTNLNSSGLKNIRA